MKKIFACLLALVQLAVCCAACAAPLPPEEALKVISSYLTEVYSYTAEEAAQFTTEVVREEDHWQIRFAPADHPEWIYTAAYHEGASKIENVSTPFFRGEKPAGYPGEGSVREGLNRARQNGWFVIWEDHMRQALNQYMNDFGITPTARLSEGLSRGGITAGDALHEYFVSCYGEEINWTPALKEWHDAEMETYGLNYADDEPVTEGIAVWQSKHFNGAERTTTRFIGEVPQELEQVFSHPKLEGWTCLCGATMQNVDNRYGSGLAAFEKDGERLLVVLTHQAGDAEWSLTPVSKKALHTDRKMYILPDASGLREATIVYENSETEKERFDVGVATMQDSRQDVAIYGYSRMDEATGTGVKMEFGSGVKVITYENHQKVSEEQTYETVTRTMSMLDINDFPTTLEDWKIAETQTIPAGYAMISGVHLRRKTSSRSTDLGDYNAGVLVRVLGTEKGDPMPWYHVQVGRAEGYMSSNYVDEAAETDIAYALNNSLPIAQAKTNIKLKKRASWLSGSVQEITEGTRMHVLANCDGGWLHVSIPQGEFGPAMDLNGTDGYIKEADVQIAGTVLALEWME